MKHIKKFETLLKFSDNRVKNHLFKPFAEKLKEILLSLKEIDNIPASSVKIYYDSSGEIKINYGYKYNELFIIKLITYDRDTGLELTMILKYFYNEYNNNSKELYKIFDNILEKYEKERCSIYRHCRDIKINDINDLTILDNIYNDVKEEFDIYIQTQKYNL